MWYCFPCARGGGVKDFALAVGEPWGTIRHSTRERARFAVQARRRQAEEQARAILQRRKDERDAALWAAWGDAHTAATEAAELLALFFRRPDLADEFPRLVSITESEYSDALFQKMVLEQRVAGEVGGCAAEYDGNPIDYLSQFGEKLDSLRAQSELKILKPDLAKLYTTDRALFGLAASLIKEKLGVSRGDLEATLKPTPDPAQEAPPPPLDDEWSDEPDPSAIDPLVYLEKKCRGELSASKSEACA